MRRRPRLVARFGAVLGPDAAGVRQGLVALSLNSTTSLVAGAFLGVFTSTLEDHPGLLVLVPAAIGLRGNIFGAFGNRISTTIHAGNFRLSVRRDTVLGQNVLAAMLLTVVMSFLLALVAKGIAVGLGVRDTLDVLSLATVSVVGGVVASVVVLGVTLGLAAGAVRYGWDLDNVTAPLVSTVGDVFTLPSLYAATFLVGVAIVTPTLGGLVSVAAIVLLVIGWRSTLDMLRQIVHESLPVLVLAGAISAGAGIALERSLDRFTLYPALLMLVPAHLSSAGALGGILSSRLSSKLFLGLSQAATSPDRAARRDIAFVFLLALPVYALNGVGAHIAAGLLGEASPGILDLVVASLMGGAVVMAFVVAVAYYATVAAYRTGLDPDTYGIPIVSSSVDFVGALSLILAIAALGIT